MKQQQIHRTMTLLACVMAFLVGALSGSAVATEVFSWTDENGIVHYGDMPPGGQKTQTINVGEPPRSSNTEANSGPDSTRNDTASDTVIKDDSDRDDSDRQETSEPQSLADAKREKIARNRKHHREARAAMDRQCAQHRARLASVEPSRRVFYQDENGESERMDDDKRISLIEESKGFIAKNCD